MKNRKITLPELYPQQQEILSHTARFKILACGRRFGKTKLAITYLAESILKGGKTAYFAPSYSMTGEVWREMKRLLAPITTETQVAERHITTVTNGSLDIWTTSNESARGRSYNAVVIDEAALIPSAEVWQAAIRPLLTDTQGTALFASTPRGRNWFWQLYQLGADDQIHEFKAWNYPTAANPYIPEAEINAARGELPERIFKQEYLAQFLEDGAAVFKNVYTVCTEHQHAPETGHHYIMGIDWGRDNDYTAVSVFNVDTMQQAALYRTNTISYIAQRDYITAIYDRYKPRVIVAEANSIGTVNIESLQANGLPVRPFMTTNHSKRQLIEHLMMQMETSAITLLNNETLIHELSSYEVQRTQTGFTYNAPPGIHDDTVIATALSVWGAKYAPSTLIDFA